MHSGKGDGLWGQNVGVAPGLGVWPACVKFGPPSCWLHKSRPAWLRVGQRCLGLNSETPGCASGACSVGVFGTRRCVGCGDGVGAGLRKSLVLMSQQQTGFASCRPKVLGLEFRKPSFPGRTLGPEPKGLGRTPATRLALVQALGTCDFRFLGLHPRCCRDNTPFPPPRH